MDAETFKKTKQKEVRRCLPFWATAYIVTVQPGMTPKRGLQGLRVI